MKAPAIFLPFLVAASTAVLAQAPGVPIVREDGKAPGEFLAAAKKLQEAGKLLTMETAKEQLGRASCTLKLPPPGSRVLSGGDLWERARAAHVRIGYLYLCTKCTNLHLNLAGGYAISEDGAVATCFHVIEPKDMKQGHLVAAIEGGGVVPVIEVLAANRANDVAIVRVQSDKPLKPLPLNTNVRPGDEASCYSDPFGRSSYFSKGIVNRFFQRRSPNAGAEFSTRVNVSTDWAPGSSGSAVLDSFGNAIGHVSEISAHGGPPKNPSGTGASKDGQTFIVFHDAARAADVQALVKPKQ